MAKEVFKLGIRQGERISRRNHGLLVMEIEWANNKPFDDLNAACKYIEQLPRNLQRFIEVTKT